MTLLVGYQNKDECFIVTDLLYTIRSKKRELEKLRRIRRDNNFFLAWTGQANRGWDTDIYNRHNKEDFLNGNLSIAGKSELTLKHRKIKETKIRLFKPPIGFLAVDINMPQVYHGEINNEGFRSLDPLDEERITMLGYHTDDCVQLKGCLTKAFNSLDKFLSAGNHGLFLTFSTIVIVKLQHHHKVYKQILD